MIHRRKGSGGLVKMIVLILVVLFLLAYFRVNIRNVIDSSVWVDNWNFVKDLSITIWEKFLKDLVLFIIDKIFGRE